MNQTAFIGQTEKLISDQIKRLELENSNTAEKVLLRETQIKQTSSDLQDAYNRLIKQSQEDCDARLIEILNSPKMEFYQNSQIQIKNKFDRLKSVISKESDKIETVDMCADIAKKYELQFENLINFLNGKIKTNFLHIDELNLNYAHKLVEKIQKENNNQSLNQFHQEQYSKYKKIGSKLSILENEYDKMINAKNEINDRITQLSSDIIKMSRKISISIQSKEYIQLNKQSFNIINIQPACLKKKMPTGNLLVLAPIHSLTRQMKGAQGASRFFLKKNMFQ